MSAITEEENANSVYQNTNGMPMANGRNLHMDLAPGELANRIVTVGAVARAEIIATFLDKDPAPITISSSRGFTTITGYYRGVHVSIVAIGMGPSMMDFFVRESRAIVKGPMVVVRFGTCGGLALDAMPGTIVVASGGSAMITRKVDAFEKFYVKAVSGAESAVEVSGTSSSNTTISVSSSSSSISSSSFSSDSYMLSKIAPSNPKLSSLVVSGLSSSVGDCVREGINVTAESFYSSQGRIDDNFEDNNSTLIDKVVVAYPGAKSMEMETFTLLHVALCSKLPIYASAAAIVVANRKSAAVIKGEELTHLEKEGGRAILEAVCNFEM